MAELSRRGFIAHTSLAGAAVAGGLAAAPLLDAPATSRRPAGPLPESLVVHVRNLMTGEIALLVGAEEFIYHDGRLVSQLLAAAAKHQGR